jgi:hypothetical protein
MVKSDWLAKIWLESALEEPLKLELGAKPSLIISIDEEGKSLTKFSTERVSAREAPGKKESSKIEPVKSEFWKVTISEVWLVKAFLVTSYPSKLSTNSPCPFIALTYDI